MKKKKIKTGGHGSIHSNIESFESIKKFILNKFNENDKLVFLGNIIGIGENAKETITRVNQLRFDLMAKYQIKPNAVVFLRGAQEEMFTKLMQLQTAPNPEEIIQWMLEHGVHQSINSYGLSVDELKAVS